MPDELDSGTKGSKRCTVSCYRCRKVKKTVHLMVVMLMFKLKNNLPDDEKYLLIFPRRNAGYAWPIASSCFPTAFRNVRAD